MVWVHLELSGLKIDIFFMLEAEASQGKECSNAGSTSFSEFLSDFSDSNPASFLVIHVQKGLKLQFKQNYKFLCLPGSHMND